MIPGPFPLTVPGVPHTARPAAGKPPALARTYLEVSREPAAAPRSPPRAAAAAAAPPAASARRDVTGSEGKGAGGGSGAGPGPGRRRPRGAHERVPGRDPAGAGRDLPGAFGLRLQRGRWVPPAGGTGGAARPGPLRTAQLLAGAVPVLPVPRLRARRPVPTPALSPQLRTWQRRAPARPPPPCPPAWRGKAPGSGRPSCTSTWAAGR